MLKLLAPVTRRPETDLEAFQEFWRSVHAPHVVNQMRPEHYYITFFDDVATLGGVEASHGLIYDGIAELWFRDWDHHKDATQSDRAKALAGVDGFGDWIEPITDAMYTTEHIIIDTPVPAEHHKWVAFVKRLEHVTRDELSAAWLDGHAPNVSASIAASNGACFRYAISNADPERESRWDGTASLWYTSAEAARVGVPTVAHEGPPDPFPALIDGPATMIFGGREIAVVR